MVCYHRAKRLRLSIAAERTITMERKEERGLDLNSLLTLGNKQLHTDGVPPSCVSGPSCNQALPSTSFQSESHPVPLGPTDPAGSII